MLPGTIVFSMMAPDGSSKALCKRQEAENQFPKENGRHLELRSNSQNDAKGSQDPPQSTKKEAKKHPKREHEHLES